MMPVTATAKTRRDLAAPVGKRQVHAEEVSRSLALYGLLARALIRSE